MSGQTINGTAGNDTLQGGSGNDTISTGAGTDLVAGYGGDDLIRVDGVGDKSINGGIGNDRFENVKALLIHIGVDAELCLSRMLKTTLDNTADVT